MAAGHTGSIPSSSGDSLAICCNNTSRHLGATHQDMEDLDELSNLTRLYQELRQDSTLVELC